MLEDEIIIKNKSKKSCKENKYNNKKKKIRFDRKKTQEWCDLKNKQLQKPYRIK